MDPDRIARAVALPRADEALEVLGVVDLFARAGTRTPDEADVWRVAVRARVAKLSEPVASA